jgi:hypothetical protein
VETVLLKLLVHFCWTDIAFCTFQHNQQFPHMRGEPEENKGRQPQLKHSHEGTGGKNQRHRHTTVGEKTEGNIATLRKYR